jgi:DNA-binding MarR family transcriptional regulator
MPRRVEPGFRRAYPGADPRSTECVINLLRTADVVESELARHLRPHGLSPATFNVLAILVGADGPLTPQEISDRRLISKATVTGLLDSLERRGLVCRGPHPTDRRMLLVDATDEGRRLLAEVRPEHHRREKELFACLTPGERSTLVDLVGRVEEHVEEYRSAPNGSGAA